ncbi:camp-regulated phosphoprotein/endosulfine conserved region-domain-containing protein [Lipomyces doorenjongii]|uniref:camp-regulated phosphoprotein/endosulfine conserved region-domain-containing protein n=1 Tax=Lipomyces doorenjongii TaxID=383834 RepID=UPI003343D5BF
MSANSAHANGVDVSSLSPDEQRIFRMYGRLPSRQDLLQNKLKDRKYFDSGDYALSKAGRASSAGVTNVGSQHPVPENIPHSHSNFTGPNHSPTGSASASPVKESSLLHESSPDGPPESPIRNRIS